MTGPGEPVFEPMDLDLTERIALRENSSSCAFEDCRRVRRAEEDPSAYRFGVIL